jgi:hypothetical protein
MSHCKITIIDEVNCKIQDLDTDTRKRLVAKFKYELPYARHMPAFKLGRWDGKVPYFNLGGTTYVNLLPEILEWLAERNWSFELEDRRPQYDFQFEQVDEDSFSHITWPNGHMAEGKPIILRDYQVEVINTFLENPMGIQEIATGAGKTIMTAALSKRVEPYGRSVVIVPNIDLVKQTEADYRNMGLDVGVFFGDRKEYGKTHTICTWQSLNNIGKKDKSELVKTVAMDQFFDGVIAIIIDECFDGDTEISTPSGKIKIKDLIPGDKIINLCEETKIYKEDTIVKVHRNLTKSSSSEMLELTFDEGQVIKVTSEHKFLTTLGWVKAKDLTENMEVIDISTYN